MGLPQKRDLEVMRDAVAIIQAAKPPVIRLFKDVQNGVKILERKHVEVLELCYRPDRQEWERLHNDPNIIILEEKDHVVKIGIKTIIRYVQRTASKEEPEDPKIKDLWPE